MVNQPLGSVEIQGCEITGAYVTSQVEELMSSSRRCTLREEVRERMRGRGDDEREVEKREKYPPGSK